MTGGCINRNTVDMINIEFWLKILKGYRYFTSENKTTVSFPSLVTERLKIYQNLMIKPKGAIEYASTIYTSVLTFD